ncbi:MAG: hypothetical protein CGU28_01140 [Candidatus Dactylopiibacterium carminicum]|uniref:YCII-related domain-containing protein n=1 Tax=Candidatus Dactylopiibacterium carminicum TaxID=857335 RepID=A0A272EVY4_9RHOO|nr:YciI family protein [Candidatus Dactylopiibacterium carminicum]KAF7599626.1 hypothetical protein BGI27_07115 [Candidatus Dactylopiibacterium carminicum]PAS94273.1 MAG: hypothetical protein CGU29_04485 [Candidatus Dactylopiibacterium carminicum]PAS98469.1 MAG: hypothetical protein CGU28_01140 [Candidatus Dactylopiibacterium carminicum]PAS99628.1 MAG: hypothetical protein BSR46_07160 [Candidatus Dactylopiibacterium carminicum]
MRFVAIFEDTPEMAEIRQQFRLQHLAYLREYASELVIGGGLRDEPGGPYLGALWVLEVESRARALEVIEADPYYQALARPYRLYSWGKAIPENQVLL